MKPLHRSDIHCFATPSLGGAPTAHRVALAHAHLEFQQRRVRRAKLLVAEMDDQIKDARKEVSEAQCLVEAYKSNIINTLHLHRMLCGTSVAELHPETDAVHVRKLSMLMREELNALETEIARRERLQTAEHERDQILFDCEDYKKNANELIEFLKPYEAWFPTLPMPYATTSSSS
jgi:hypothetical protein